MAIAKIIVSGPFGSGKTTLIKHVSDEQFSGKDVTTTGSLAQYKSMTTVGLDFGILNIDDDLSVHLFGTPGQSRFSFMWKILSKGALGGVLLVDSASDRAIGEAQEMIKVWNEIADFPIIIGATKQDLPEAISLEELALKLNSGEIPIFTVDAREREDNRMLVMGLLQNIILAEEGFTEESFDSLSLE